MEVITEMGRSAIWGLSILERGAFWEQGLFKLTVNSATERQEASLLCRPTLPECNCTCDIKTLVLAAREPDTYPAVPSSLEGT